jgi:hypothetical protein
MSRIFPPGIDHPPLMLCQLDTLRAHAVEHGNHWKDDLRAALVSGTIHPSLSRLRATQGSRWRSNFQSSRGLHKSHHSLQFGRKFPSHTLWTDKQTSISGFVQRDNGARWRRPRRPIRPHAGGVCYHANVGARIRGRNCLVERTAEMTPV